MTTERDNAEVHMPNLESKFNAPAPKSAKSGILAALLRSPLAGADLNLVRPQVDMRKADL